MRKAGARLCGVLMIAASNGQEGELAPPGMFHQESLKQRVVRLDSYVCVDGVKPERALTAARDLAFDSHRDTNKLVQEKICLMYHGLAQLTGGRLDLPDAEGNAVQIFEVDMPLEGLFKMGYAIVQDIKN